jgi:hypothetical protein
MATMADAEAIAAVLTPSFRTLTFLPMLHTAEEKTPDVLYRWER